MPMHILMQASSTFVAGATGGVGREVVSLLIQKGMHIKALVRDRSAGVRCCQLPQ